LPGLKTPGVVLERVPAGLGPRRRADLDNRRMQPADTVLVDVEKPGPAGPTQELAAGGGEELTADRVHVDRHLTDGLAGVEQEGNPGLTGDRAHLRDRVDQPPPPPPLPQPHAPDPLLPY